MKIPALLCILIVPVVIAMCGAHEAQAQEPEGPTKIRSAGASGMAYGSVMIAAIIMIVLPSVLLLLITRIVHLGVEEIGLIRCVYTSLIFFAVVALVFYYFAEGLERGLINPAEFFSNNSLLAGLCIALGVSFLLLHFFLYGTLLRSLLGGVIYVVGYYGCACLAYALIAASEAQDLFRSSVGG